MRFTKRISLPVPASQDSLVKTSTVFDKQKINFQLLLLISADQLTKKNAKI